MRPEIKNRPSYRVGSFVVDGHTEEVTSIGATISLGHTAFEVFCQLVEARGAIVLRSQFRQWDKETHFDRHPVDGYVSKINRSLGGKIIQSVSGKGYRLTPGIGVEMIPTPSYSDLEKLLTVVLDQIKAHSSSSFLATIKNCEVLLKQGHFADAFVPMALAYINLGHVGFCRVLHAKTILKARDIISEALRIFPTLASPYALRGLTSLIYDYDWKAAESDLNHALALAPTSDLAHTFLAHLKIAQGSFEEGLKHIRTAVKLDYDSPMTVATEPWLTLFAGRVDEAVRKGEAVSDGFSHFAPAHDLLGHAYCAEGSFERAIEEYKKTLNIEFIPDAVASLGYAYAKMGNRKAALNQLDVLNQAAKDGKIAYVSGYFESLVRAGLGEKKRCLDALERAFEERCDWLIYLAVEPRWKELRNEKRFQALLRRVGIRVRGGR